MTSEECSLLIDRLKTSTDAATKSEALERLGELSEDQPYEVGKGIAVLMDTLRASVKGFEPGGHPDLEACGTIIEILENLVTPGRGGEGTSSVAAANTAILVPPTKTSSFSSVGTAPPPPPPLLLHGILGHVSRGCSARHPVRRCPRRVSPPTHPPTRPPS